MEPLDPPSDIILGSARDAALAPPVRDAATAHFQVIHMARAFTLVQGHCRVESGCPP